MILSDTHTFLWFITADRRLGRLSNRMMWQASLDRDLAFSAISIWEVSMLLQKGRLDVTFNVNASQWRQDLIARGLTEIPVDCAIAARAGDLEDMHGDPADRIIVATALEGGHRLITNDTNILNWPHQLDRFPARR
ncbi:MAG: type II toxin-antitoxin system VapC family toxin [Dehalococcoidia bacterium]|nr:type II toxin-antitoxin system VapC family toxin [Dehalococcoidia bacterium]